MDEAKRKSYTATFKAKVALEAIRGVKTVNEIGQAYGVHPVQLRDRLRRPGSPVDHSLRKMSLIFEPSRATITLLPIK